MLRILKELDGNKRPRRREEMERVLSASAAMLLLLSGDVETNPGPIGRSKSREPKPDPKKIMEEKVG